MGGRVVRVSIPFNLARAGGRVVGLDAYFWDSVSVEARRALLIRPAEGLEETPPGGYRPLRARAGLARQLADLESLRAGHLRWAARHARWKLARMLLPAREPPGGWEYAQARGILEGLGLGAGSEPAGLGWLAVEFRVASGVAVLGSGVEDRVYTWLLRRDWVFLREVRGL
ncbi:MAG: hypothetical protein LRS49_01075 [Desulfurococcales archaeon]|nr:hypothetical protein [Desulfurococcales archaeon]